jgi:hypothetical protein
MKKFFFARVGWSRSCGALGPGLALALAFFGAPAHAGQNVGTFDVKISLDAPAVDSCGTANVGGGSLAVVCGNPASGASKVAAADTGATGGYRLLTRREDAIVSADAFGGAIATTAVRVLNVAGRQFIEMTVGW